jgi:outer membrane protein assembly factor BamB
MFKKALQTLAILCAIGQNLPVTAAAETRRPFRLGVYKLNRSLDEIKPLAAADSAGYAIQGGILFGGYDSTRFMAWDLTQKKHLWWTTIDGDVTSPPLLIENTLFFSTRSGKFYAVNASTGQINWDLTLDAHVERPLLFSNGRLFIVTVGQVAYSVDAASGKRYWVFDAGFPDQITVKRPPAPIINDDKVVFAIASGELVAIKIDDGKISWRYNPLYIESRFHDPVGDMVLANNKLLITRYDGLIAEVSIADDRRISWQDKQTSIATSMFRGGRYYAGLVSGDVMAYDVATGRSIWRVSTAATPAYIVVGETSLFAIANDGRIFTIDLSDGRIVWVDDLGSRIASPPIVTENRMYISTGLRNMYGYRL